MKILFITGLHPTESNRMSGVFITRMLKKLQEHGLDFDVYVYSIEENKLLKNINKLFRRPMNKSGKALNINNVIYKNITIKIGVIDRLLYKYRFPLLAVQETIKQIDFYQYDLIHAHWVYPHGYIAYLLKNKLKLPIIISAHGSDIHTVPFKNDRIKSFVINALDSAEAIIFNSYGLLKVAQKIGIKGDNTKVLPIGVDTNIFFPIDKKMAVDNLNKKNLYGKPVVGFVGNLVWVKGADRLPEIFKQVSEIFENVTFVIIGNGILKASIEDKCMLYGLDVICPGQVNPDEIPVWMNLLDVLVMPSRNEGFGSVVIEAQACGCPVVGTDVGGIPEAIGDGGTIVPYEPEFVKIFGDAVCKLLKKPIDRKFLRERALKFDWDSIINKQIEIYRDIIEAKK